MNDKKHIVSNFLWRALERFGAQGVTLAVSVVLARRLDPEVYGDVALVAVFTTILAVFVSCCLNDALVQKKDADDLDFSTVFFFNMVSGPVLYAILFVCAPLVATLFHRPTLTPLIRGLGLVLPIGAVRNIQAAYVSRNLLFKRFFFATLTGTLLAAAVGIWMAYHDYGGWALIVQNLLNMTVDTLILWVTVRWRPKKMFSWQRLKGLFRFSWKLMVSTVIDTVYGRIYQLIIGLKYSSADLAYFNKGDTLPNQLVTAINTATDSVLLPVMSASQDDPQRVREMTRRAIRISTYVIMPLMMGIAVVAEPGIRFLIGAKWLPCVPYLRIFCFCYAFYCVHTANLNAMKALGRSDIFLKLEIIKKIVGLTLLVISLWHGVMAMAWASLITSVLSQVINAWPNKKLLGYSYVDQLKDMLPHIALTLFMGAAVYAVTFLGLGDLPTLLIQIPLGVGIYVAGSLLFKMECWGFLLSVMKKKEPESAQNPAE